MKMPFQVEGVGELSGPIPLKVQGMGLKKLPGLYVVTCGSCIAHVGTSGQLGERVRQLATLRNHRGSDEVLCAAFCSGSEPVIWWKECQNVSEAWQLEKVIKAQVGEPPVPEKYRRCKHGGELRDKLVEAAGHNSWEAGFIEAVFKIGEQFYLLFQKRFDPLWKTVGKPPGPWANG